MNCAKQLQCRALEIDLAEAEEKIAFLKRTHDDMADTIEDLRQQNVDLTEAMYDIVAVIGIGGTNWAERVLNIAKFAIGITEKDND